MTPTTTPFPGTWTLSATNLRGKFKDLSKRLNATEQATLLTKLLFDLKGRDYEDFRTDFYGFAHEHQQPPACANSGEPWTTWLMLGGRGAGKTRAGAEWVRELALADPKARIALVGETEHDVREVMVEGVSGLLAVHRHRERPVWIAVAPAAANGRTARWRRRSRRKIRRACAGRNSRAAWCDELAKWRHAEATFDMLQFGLRLGERPRQVDHHHAAADRAAQAADRRSAHRGDARRHARQRAQSGAGVSRRRCWRATPARGSAGRRSTARSSRSAPTRCGRAR